MKTLIFIFLLSLMACNDKAVSGLNPLDSYLNSGDSNNNSDPVVSTTTDAYMQLVNDRRNELGLRTLIYSADIESEAKKHSNNMASGSVAFGHTGSSSRCSAIISDLGGGNLCGEIVAMGQDNAQEVFNSWMNSPGHRSKIEGSRYTHTGFGFARKSNGTIYWTQIFLEVP